MINRVSKLVDTVFTNRKKTADFKEPSQDKKWVLVEDNGKTYLSRIDFDDMEKKADFNYKHASKYKDFDAYIKMIYPKEYANNYAKDTYNKKSSFFEGIKKVASKGSSSIKKDIDNIEDFSAGELAVLAKDIYSSVIGDNDSKKQAHFIDAFVKDIKRKSTAVKVQENIIEGVKKAISLSTNPYEYIRENLVAVFGKEPIIDTVHKAVFQGKVSENDLNPHYLEILVLEQPKEASVSNFEFKEGFQAGLEGSVINKESYMYLDGYFKGKDSSFK